MSAKSQTPPTVADTECHKRCKDDVDDIVQQNHIVISEIVPGSEELEYYPPVSKIPFKLQEYANKFSLKMTPEEIQLQEQVELLPKAIMSGATDEANLMCLFLEMMDAKTVVEIGVFRGMTTLAFALCLRNLEKKSERTHRRRVIALDITDEFTEIGKKAWAQAGVEKFIDFRIGDARYSLEALLADEGEECVDLCFIDADKSSYDEYYEKCLKITKKGGLIVIDNTLWGARVLLDDSVLDSIQNINDNRDSWDTDPSMSKANITAFVDAKAIKDLTKKISADNRVERVCFLTIADGVTICRKK